ncbi:cell wall hydrolase [Methylocaldum gracile]|jgi:spore germination cell wall hydrolase CwlJ-like protein|uniref:cell wall hydrolase n=1 Tax=unclassified Methylocaldum TaxID=2622260 RepID=UPI0010604378
MYTPIPPKRASVEEIDTLARTLYGEARGEGILGMSAVAAVIMNRARKRRADGGPYWWGDGIIGVCMKPQQFSCWNPDDPNRAKLLNVTERDPLFAQARVIAHIASAGWLADPTGGADHYHASSILPKWAVGIEMTAKIGRHVFYKLS